MSDNKASASAWQRVPAQDREAFSAHKSDEVSGFPGLTPPHAFSSLPLHFCRLFRLMAC
jgi:hypothetical protein